MEKIITVIDSKSSKEFLQGTFILDYFALGVGILCLLLYVLFGVKDNHWLKGMNLILLSVGILLLVMAIVLLSMLYKALKKADEFKRTITYDFQDDYFTYEVIRNDEIIESGKLLYSDLTSYKETENYIYAGLKNNSWFSISKVDGLIDFLNNKGVRRYKSKKK